MTKLERARKFLTQTARPGLRVLSIALLAVSAYAGEIFSVSGTFDGGDTLSGTITIDTTGSGGILSADLTVDPVVVSYPFDSAPTSGAFEQFTTLSSSTSYFYEATFSGSGTSSLTLDIDTGADTFAGYTGGNLCSDTTYCGGSGNETYFNPFTTADPPLMSGGLTDIGPSPSSAPEPSGVLLTITGAGAVLALRRRKRRT